MTLKVWGRISSINVRKVVLAAQWLQLPFERIDAGKIFGMVNTPQFKQMNPNAMIPVIEYEGFVLWESNVIVRYLCAKHASVLYPQNFKERFEAERWMDWQQAEINRASGAAFIQWIRTAPEERNPQVIAQSVAATEPLLAILDAQLSRHAFVAGEAMTMADFPIAVEVHRWWGLPQPRPAYPQIERWYAALLANPASRGVLDVPLS
jgi:glutathione S-transferase